MNRVPVAALPLAGAALGWGGARVLSFLDPLLGSSLAALAVLAFWSAITRVRLENAVASRIGIVTLVFLLLMRWQAVMRLPANAVNELAACLALSRGAMVALAYTTRPCDGLADRWRGWEAAVAVLSAAAFVFLPGPRLALVLLAAAAFAVALLRNWFSVRMGGVDEPGLDAACLAIETWLIVLASCRNCPWWS